MGYLRWNGNRTILLIKQNEPAGILKVNKDGSVLEIPYTTKRARKSKKLKVS